MIDKQVIHVPDLKAIGPYSQAVRAAGLLFVSGQREWILLTAKPWATASNYRSDRYFGISIWFSGPEAADSTLLSIPPFSLRMSPTSLRSIARSPNTFQRILLLG